MTNPFELGEVLGIGGMGRVYAIDARRAVKVLAEPFVGNPVMVARLRDEAEIARRIHHRNVVRVHESGELAGVPYLMMDRIDGESLGDRIRRDGALPMPMLKTIGLQILAGLEAIHAAGYVHGDLKSDNVLVSPSNDRVTIIDFGLAHAIDEFRNRDDDRVSGTPDYMAPEVIRGGQASTRSDLYAVGVILYEMLTGSTPFAGGTPTAVFERQLSDDVVAPTLRCPGRTIPPAFEAVVMRAVAKDPMARHHDAAMFATALARALRGPLLDDARVRSEHSFSTTAPTREWETRGPRAHRRLADGTSPIESAAVMRLRAELREARLVGKVDAISIAHLAVAQALVEDHRLGAAAQELENAVAWAQQHASAEHRWPLLLSLAAVCDGAGETDRAERLAANALEASITAHSDVGRRRAEQLVHRLAVRRPSPTQQVTRSARAARR